MCAMMQKFRMNFGSIVLAYKMFSLTNFHNCGQDSNGPRGLPAGLLHTNELHKQRKNRAE
jgi:hypothetical protein